MGGRAVAFLLMTVVPGRGKQSVCHVRPNAGTWRRMSDCGKTTASYPGDGRWRDRSPWGVVLVIDYCRSDTTGAIVLNWFLKPKGSAHAPDGITAYSEALTISHDCCRYAFGHVIWADVDTL